MRLTALSKPCTHCSTAEGHPVYASPPLYISLFCDFHNISPLMITNAAVHKTYGQGKGTLLWVKQQLYSYQNTCKLKKICVVLNSLPKK